MLLGRVGIKALRSEGRPLLVSIVPIAALATWCFLRLEFHAPQEQDGVDLRAYTSVSLVGSVVHVVPEAGISAASWTAEVEADADAEVARGVAIWTLQGKGRPDPYRLTIRLGEVTCERDVSFAPGPYAAPTAEHDDGRVVTELGLRPVNLWGLAPGLPALQLPPWLVAYVVLVIPVVWISRRLLRVA